MLYTFFHIDPNDDPEKMKNTTDDQAHVYIKIIVLVGR